MVDKLPNEIKAHHLPALVIKISREQWIKLLKEYGSNFADTVLNLYDILRSNEDYRLKIISGGPDIICNSCPRNKFCYDGGSEKNEAMLFLDNYFLRGNYFEVGKTYTVKEIIDNFDPNTGGWLDEIKEKLASIENS